MGRGRKPERILTWPAKPKPQKQTKSESPVSVDMWSYSPGDELRHNNRPVEPMVLPPPHNWYEFCTRVYYNYLEKGEPIAALVYWCMRFWVPIVETQTLEPHDPTTEEGFEEVGKYFDYKRETVPHMFG